MKTILFRTLIVVQPISHPTHVLKIRVQALMKITKHCHEECAGNLEVAQGALLGLIVGKTLEITNCFAFPKNCDDSIDEGNVEMKNFDRLMGKLYYVIIECLSSCRGLSAGYDETATSG